MNNEFLAGIPNMHRVVIHLDGEQGLNQVPTDLINSFRNIFNGGGGGTTTAPPKKNKTQDIIKELKRIGPQDVDEFPNECSICLSPFVNIELMDDETKIKYLTQISKIQQEYLNNGASPTDPSIPLPSDAYDKKIKYYKLRGDDTTLNQDHELVQIPSCKHIFGKSCITTWLKTNSSCPLCRSDIINSGSLLKHEQNDTMVYPVSFAEAFAPSSWTDFDENLGTNQDPDISLPIQSQNIHGVTGPRRGPLLSEIQQRYTEEVHADDDDVSMTPREIEAQPGGGPVRSSSRNSNNRSHPYNRF